MVFDQNYNEIQSETLYDKLGSIEGIRNIMETVFKAIMQDEGLAKFYKDKNINEIKKKYSYYIAGQIGGQYDWLG